VNIFRATAVRRALNKPKIAHGGVLPVLIYAMYIVKERILRLGEAIDQNLHSIRPLLCAFDHNCRIRGV
jgi:hypothetical protein